MYITHFLSLCNKGKRDDKMVLCIVSGRDVIEINFLSPLSYVSYSEDVTKIQQIKLFKFVLVNLLNHLWL